MWYSLCGISIIQSFLEYDDLPLRCCSRHDRGVLISFNQDCDVIGSAGVARCRSGGVKCAICPCGIELCSDVVNFNLDIQHVSSADMLLVPAVAFGIFQILTDLEVDVVWV